MLILRGVTDLVDAPVSDPTYHVADAWERASFAVMASLVGLRGEALPELIAQDAAQAVQSELARNRSMPDAY